MHNDEIQKDKFGIGSKSRICDIQRKLCVADYY